MFIFDPPERNVSVNKQQPLKFTSNGEIVFLTGLQFTAGSLNIFGLDVTLTVNPISDGSDVAMEDVACAVVFVGRDSQSVIASNPVRWELCVKVPKQYSLPRHALQNVRAVFSCD